MGKKGMSNKQEGIVVWTIASIMATMVFYFMFMNIYTRFNHPEFTETQIIIRTFNWKYNP